jgi:aryl-alcohol dehydrogenase-like predicted oxidoreductase
MAFSGTASAAAVSGPAFPRAVLPASAVDKRVLGKTGIEVSLVGMGTGSIGTGQASNQTRLGVQEFTRIVRHALDRGVCFFDVADQYGSHVYLRAALEGVPRDRYVIQTKTHSTDLRNCRSHIERYRMELGVDMIDIVLLHCMTTKDWPQQHTGSMEYLMKMREQGVIRAHGTSCHGIAPLRTSAEHEFVQVDLARINPKGLIMDDAKPETVAAELARFHDRGAGVVGMKILGEGRIKEPADKDESLRFVIGLGTVDAFVIGFESTEQVDDLLDRAERAIAALRG